MTQREKILAALVGALLAVGGVLYLTTSLQAAFKTRRDRLAALQSQLDDKEFAILKGARAQERLAEYERRALPADERLAGSLYQQWLFEVADRRVGLKSVNIARAAGSQRTKSGAFTVHTFTINGKGDLRQFRALLQQFYSVDFLHRVKQLRVTPERESKVLGLAMTVEALSLPGAPDRERLEAGDARLAAAALEELAAPILERNLFAPPNQPPALARIGTQQATVSRPWSLTVQATDPDKLDEVRYELQAEGIRGAAIDSRSGRISWTPPTTGTYRMTVHARDDGIPSRSASQTFEVVVSNPQPERRPEPVARTRPFELQFTYLTAITEARGEREAWVSVRTTGELMKLREGDEFSVRGFEGTVREIRDSAITYDAEGKQFTVALGDHFDQSAEMSGSQARASVNDEVARP